VYLDLTKTNEWIGKFWHMDGIENHLLVEIPKVQKDNYCIFYLEVESRPNMIIINNNNNMAKQ
jgi:hypothetical protein